MGDADTICAISTPAGEGGISIIRMSGSRSLPIMKEIFEPKKQGEGFDSHHLVLGHIFHPQKKKPIDEVFAVFMEAPRTYTRENIVEIYSHGGFATQREILQLLTNRGARLAEPGEFTKRAYLNGRIDLSQAEAVLDIVRSETEEELACAMDGLSGNFSEKINIFKNSIREFLAETEALIDFPDEELDIDSGKFEAGLEKIEGEITRLVDSYLEGKAITAGLEVLIVGRTNVGKSSILNSLLLKERAIVTPLPGTTRDLIEDTIHIKGIKAKIIDSAGLRDPLDIVEKEGIERVKRKIPRADLILWVIDSSQALTSDDYAILDIISNKNFICVLNKTDLPAAIMEKESVLARLQKIRTSARKDLGLDELKVAIYEKLIGRRDKSKGIVVTHLRHRDALQNALESIRRAVECVRCADPLEFQAFELREALSYLGEITGETCPEEILNQIFERFCIGK